MLCVCLCIMYLKEWAVHSVDSNSRQNTCVFVFGCVCVCACVCPVADGSVVLLSICSLHLTVGN